MQNPIPFVLKPLAVRAAVIVLFSLASTICFSQPRDTTFFFRGVVSVTQNGFSFIPSFSLGKPAVIFEPAVGNKRISFEPQFRFALEGKPWSFIFIFRYKVIDKGKFTLHVGGHLPSFNFITQTVTWNGKDEDVIISRRFLAAELIPNYTITKNISVGMYMLRGHGFDKGGVNDSYFAGVRSTINNINLTKRIFLRVTPQLYYLRTDDDEGTYFTNIATLAIRNFPLSFQNIINKAIETEIPAKTFDWNVSLLYSFSKSYVRNR